MHILFIINSLSSGGAERVAVNLANYWAAKGQTITIVTMTGSDQPFYSLRSEVKIVPMDLSSLSSGSVSAIRNNLKRIITLRAILKYEKPSIALGFMTTSNILLVIAGIGLGIKLFGSEHIHPPMFPLGRAWEWLRRLTYPWLQDISAPTEESAQWLRVNCGTSRVHAIKNPIPYPLPTQPPTLHPEEYVSNDNAKRMLLAVGRLDPQKGFDRLISAFVHLAPIFPNWLLVILGEGPSRADLELQVAKHGLAAQVIFPGAAGNIGEWYEAADLYVMTSRFEGFGNTLAEALTYGLPAVSINCKVGPSEILRNEIDGLLVPQDNQPELISTLTLLMKDGELRKMYSSRAIEARQRFSVKQNADTWEKLFKSTGADTTP